MSYSASTMLLVPNVLVSTMSLPASKYRRWIASISSGRVKTSISLQPSMSFPRMRWAVSRTWLGRPGWSGSRSKSVAVSPAP